MSAAAPIAVVRLKPNQFIHLLNNNTNTTTLLTGPLTYTRLDHEYFVPATPQNFICVPPNRYCIVQNPVVRDPATNAVVLDAYGQAKVRLGDLEIRFTQDPFPLYPGEVLQQDVTKLQVVPELQALRVMSNRDFDETQPDGTVIKRRAGDVWMVRGPVTYIPRVEVDVIATIQATIICAAEALKVRATADFVDGRAGGVPRRAGEEWLVSQPGAFIPEIDEEVVEKLSAEVLTERQAIYVTTKVNFVDRFGKARSAGDVWLVTNAETESFIPSVEEIVAEKVRLTVVGQRQFCVVNNVYVNGVSCLGKQELRNGLCSFFLQPGETLEGGVRDVIVLTSNEALLLRSVQTFTDASGTIREPGSRWLVRGPTDYTPPIEVEVLERRASIPLDVNEGVYIRDVRTGVVRAHIGSTIMLNEDEELWSKQLDPLVEELLALPKLTKAVSSAPVWGQENAVTRRAPHRVVTCNVPHNALVQVYDYKEKQCRLVLGPDLVMLMPDEEFTVISLSGGRPKRPDVIKTLCLQLGPDFMADVIIIETLDHARLQLELSYNWEFDPAIALHGGSAFTVPDFVGDACKTIASRIRGFVSNETFDAFHRNSSNIIKYAVFGKDPDTGVLGSSFTFAANGLRITNVDVHSVDPVDPKTREALTKSVQLAIEITTKSQEAIAIQQATAGEQSAKGRLERQVIKDKALAEVERRSLLEIEAHNAAIESTGASKANARAAAEGMIIEGQSEVDLAAKRSEASEIGSSTELEVERLQKEDELSYRQSINDLEVAKARELSAIEADKFKRVIKAIGKDTIKAIARAGPELQAKLLQGLGLQGYLVTDGTNPINLFNTAKGLTSAVVTQ